jgi:hypothetical protein
VEEEEEERKRQRQRKKKGQKDDGREAGGEMPIRWQVRWDVATITSLLPEAPIRVCTLQVAAKVSNSYMYCSPLFTYIISSWVATSPSLS